MLAVEDFSGLSAANMASFWGTDLREIDGIFFPEGLLAVNNRSKNPELAGRFIRAAFSFEMQTEYTGGSGFPVNGRAFAEGFENQQEENQKRKERAVPQIFFPVKIVLRFFQQYLQNRRIYYARLLDAFYDLI